MNNTDIQRLVAYCQLNLDFENAGLNDEFFYAHLPLCLIDAIFSIRANYTSTRNTVIRFCNYVNIQRIGKIDPEQTREYSIQDLIALYSIAPIALISEKVFGNKQTTSSRGILKAEAVFDAAGILAKYGANYLADVGKIINNSDFEAEYKKVRGQASGISLRYFYMLAGSTAHVKPDRMVKRFISAALNTMPTTEECDELLTQVCKRLNTISIDIDPRTLDHLIWNYQRSLNAPKKKQK